MSRLKGVVFVLLFVVTAVACRSGESRREPSNVESTQAIVPATLVGMGVLSAADVADSSWFGTFVAQTGLCGPIYPRLHGTPTPGSERLRDEFAPTLLTESKDSDFKTATCSGSLVEDTTHAGSYIFYQSYYSERDPAGVGFVLSEQPASAPLPPLLQQPPAGTERAGDFNFEYWYSSEIWARFALGVSLGGEPMVGVVHTISPSPHLHDVIAFIQHLEPDPQRS